MSYDNSNSGFIGKNTRKETDTHPDISGSCEVGGVQYWISGWKNAKGYGLKFKPKEASKPAASKPSAATDEFPDDDIPF